MEISAAHVHLMLNHVPVLGIPFSAVVLGWALWRRNAALMRPLAGLVVLLAIVTLPVFFTGEPAEEIVEDLPGVSEQLIESHEEAAELSIILVMASGAVALISMLLANGSVAQRYIAPLLLLLLLASTASLFVTASYGGQIRHSEIRGGALNLEAGRELSKGEH